MHCLCGLRLDLHPYNESVTTAHWTYRRCKINVGEPFTHSRYSYWGRNRTSRQAVGPPWSILRACDECYKPHALQHAGHGGWRHNSLFQSVNDIRKGPVLLLKGEPVDGEKSKIPLYNWIIYLNNKNNKTGFFQFFYNFLRNNGRIALPTVEHF